MDKDAALGYRMVWLEEGSLQWKLRLWAPNSAVGAHQLEISPSSITILSSVTIEARLQVPDLQIPIPKP